MKKLFVAALVSLLFIAPTFAAETDVRGACQADIKSLCPGIQPGGGRLKVCIKEHKDQLSSGCKSALIEQAKAGQSGNGQRRGNTGNSSDPTG